MWFTSTKKIMPDNAASIEIDGQSGEYKAIFEVFA
jgi:hypothetical protein